MKESDEKTVTEFLRAVAAGDGEAVKSLVEQGVPLDMSVAIQGSHRMCPIHLAAGWGHGDVVGVFLDAGVDIDVLDECGKTPLMVAANLGQAVLVIKLLVAGADGEACERRQGLRAIHLAAATGKDAAVVALLQGGVDGNAVDSEGMTALHYAVHGDRNVSTTLRHPLFMFTEQPAPVSAG